jgi:hypothetical protein
VVMVIGVGDGEEHDTTVSVSARDWWAKVGLTVLVLLAGTIAVVIMIAVLVRSRTLRA